MGIFSWSPFLVYQWTTFDTEAFWDDERVTGVHFFWMTTEGRVTKSSKQIKCNGTGEG